jgi:hypothetical protein
VVVHKENGPGIVLRYFCEVRDLQNLTIAAVVFQRIRRDPPPIAGSISLMCSEVAVFRRERIQGIKQVSQDAASLFLVLVRLSWRLVSLFPLQPRARLRDQFFVLFHAVQVFQPICEDWDKVFLAHGAR